MQAPIVYGPAPRLQGHTTSASGQPPRNGRRARARDCVGYAHRRTRVRSDGARARCPAAHRLLSAERRAEEVSRTSPADLPQAGCGWGGGGGRVASGNMPGRRLRCDLGTKLREQRARRSGGIRHGSEGWGTASGRKLTSGISSDLGHEAARPEGRKSASGRGGQNGSPGLGGLGPTGGRGDVN